MNLQSISREQFLNVIEVHLNECIKDVNLIGCWGLKAREQQSLARIESNTNSINLLMNKDIEVLYGEDSRVKIFWSEFVHEYHVIAVTREEFSQVLRQLMSRREENEEIIGLAAKTMTFELTQCNHVTLTQVREYLSRFHSRLSVDDILDITLDTIHVTQQSNLELTLSRFLTRDSIPPEVTWTICQIIKFSNEEMKVSLAKKWLHRMRETNDKQVIFFHI